VLPPIAFFFSPGRSGRKTEKRSSPALLEAFLVVRQGGARNLHLSGFFSFFFFLCSYVFFFAHFSFQEGTFEAGHPPLFFFFRARELPRRWFVPSSFFFFLCLPGFPEREAGFSFFSFSSAPRSCTPWRSGPPLFSSSFSSEGAFLSVGRVEEACGQPFALARQWWGPLAGPFSLLFVFCKRNFFFPGDDEDLFGRSFFFFFPQRATGGCWVFFFPSFTPGALFSTIVGGSTHLPPPLFLFLQMIANTTRLFPFSFFFCPSSLWLFSPPHGGPAFFSPFRGGRSSSL